MKLVSPFIVAFLLIGFINKALAQDTIHWAPNYILKWEDFRGLPNNNVWYKALTATETLFTLTHNGVSFKTEITCVFNKNKSWVSSPDDALLKHEQGHFNIAEIFTRKLRRAIKEYNYNPDTVEKDIDQIFNKIQVERKKWERLYDKETNFSINKQKQAYWTAKIKNELNRLYAFCK